MTTQLQDKRVAIVGLGASGLAAAELCRSRGARVELFDEAAAPAPASAWAEAHAISLITGPLSPDALAAAELVVVSPGVPPREAIARAEARGAPAVSEIELASWFIAAPLVLIGGTNGKSTVTALCHGMLEASLSAAGAPLSVFIGGNFGTPLCEAAARPFDVLVVEISSFQAERVPTLRPRVNVLLNVSEDHLDRYPSFQAYADAKGNAFVNMTADDLAVIPSGDEACSAQARRGAARVVTFSLTDEHADVHLEDEALVASDERYPVADIALRGRHNLANACAAIAAARAVGATPDGIRATLKSFTGLPHRHALVAEKDGIRFYDDSKATNVGAAVAALSGLEEASAVLIAGGRDKLGDYAPLVEALRARGRALVVIGEAADRIASAAEGSVPVHRASTVEEAVGLAATLAQPGDAVLLSPACSSYDMFTSYKARGEAFSAAVHALGGAR